MSERSERIIGLSAAVPHAAAERSEAVPLAAAEPSEAAA
jgi:hypothetical protein